MPLRVRFGLSGHPQQRHLPGTDPALLPGLVALAAAPDPEALSSESFSPARDGSEALFGGRATAATTGFGTGGGQRTVLDVAGPWNSVKNAAAAADGAAGIAFVGFVHVDAALGLASEEGSTLELVGAKRGNVATGAGADRIDVRFASNSIAWSNEFRFAPGAGNDEVRLAPLDVAAAAGAGDATFATPELASGFDGEDVTIWAELGDGDDLLSTEGAVRVVAHGGAGRDRITLGDGASSVHGGAGDDSMAGGRGADHLAGDGGDDALAGGDGLGDAAVYAGRAAGFEVRFSAADRLVTVRDIDPSDGDEGTDTLSGIERLHFSDRTVDAPTLPPGTPAVVFYPIIGGHHPTTGGRFELWATDGTAAGTVPVEDIEPGAGSGDGYPYDWVSLGDGRALIAAGWRGTGVELWATDGTAAGTVPVKSIAPSADRYHDHSYGPVALGGGRAVFATGDGAGSFELWATDGTAEGTATVGPVASRGGGGGPSLAHGLVALGDGRALFTKADGDAGLELWATDGTAPGTAPVATVARTAVPEDEQHWPHGLVALGDGRALFDAGGPATGRELWITDGTAAGTAMVKDLEPGEGHGQPYGPVPLGDGRALFSAFDGVHGRELWITDGTPAGTALVKEIEPGPDFSEPGMGILGSSNPVGFFALGDGRALFSAFDGTHGHELWVTDGTAAGTAMVKDIDPSNGRLDPWELAYGLSGWGSPYGFCALGDGRVLFCAGDGVHGRELWVTDGTAAGTAMVEDIEPGAESGHPWGLTASGDGRALFTAHTGAHGQELWITDGTALLKDVNPGPANSGGFSAPMPVVVAGGASGAADPFG